MKSENDSLDINKKMIGKMVLVVSGKSEYRGIIIDVLDSQTFQIKKNNSSKILDVDIFDIRSL
jgi:hypothetical protein